MSSVEPIVVDNCWLGLGLASQIFAPVLMSTILNCVTRACEAVGVGLRACVCTWRRAWSRTVRVRLLFSFFCLFLFFQSSMEIQIRVWIRL